MDIKRLIINNKNGLALGFLTGYIVVFIMSQTFVQIPYLESIKQEFVNKGISFQDLFERASLIFLLVTTIIGGIIYYYSDWLKSKVNFSAKQLFYTSAVLAAIYYIGQSTDLFALNPLKTVGKVTSVAKYTGFIGLLGGLFAIKPILAIIGLIGIVLIFAIPSIAFSMALFKNFNMIIITVAVAVVLILVLGGKRR